MICINVLWNDYTRETVDEFATYKESRAMLKEYKIAFSEYKRLYLSSRCCKDWK